MEKGPDQEDIGLTGGCQCGAIRFRTTHILDDAHLCHCRMCQKAVANYFAALVSTRKDNLQWTNQVPHFWQSSENVWRGFCPDCGTPLYYDDRQSDHIGLMIGAFDKPSIIVLRSQEGLEGRMNWFPAIDGIAEGGVTEKSGRADWALRIKQTNRQFQAAIFHDPLILK